MSQDEFRINKIEKGIQREDFLSTYPEAEKILDEMHKRGAIFAEYLSSLKIGDKQMILEVTIDMMNLKIHTTFNQEVLK